MMHAGTLLSWMTRRLAQVGGATLAVISILLVVDVICRRVFNSPITGVLDIVEVTFVIVTFFAFAQVKAAGREIRMDVLRDRFHGKPAYALEIAASVVSAIFFGLILWVGSQNWLDAWQMHEGRMGRLGIPMVIPWGVVVFGSCFMVIAQIRSIIGSICALFSGHRQV